MKLSNILLISLCIILLLAVFETDFILADQYKKVNLKDPYRNFKSIAVKPFKVLSITGGNGYAIIIKQESNFNIRLMNSRKDFFSMKRSNDTLFISFTVANQNYQQPEASTVGLILSMPEIKLIQLSGTNNEVGPFTQDSLSITQDKSTVTRMKQLHLEFLKLEGTGSAYYDFISENVINRINIDMKNKTVTNFHQVRYKKLQPVLHDSAGIVLYKQSLGDLEHEKYVDTPGSNE